jgi:dihydroxy-acid dehydratase
VRDGDRINFDVEARRIDVELTDEQIAERVAQYRPPEPHYRGGVMAKYAASVGSASEGAVTS